MNASIAKSKPSALWWLWVGLALYIAIGAVWVLVGEPWLASIALDKTHLQHYQELKGALYVLVSGALGWWLLRRV